ncbi:hypothetical protein [Trichocoleus sp. FACHB-262]|uniref:hypothetical protein n=1 Tax=Trichocoleus sp. FACHB-262 TaxID=2692869 RepID=UPI0016889E4A|nr:hypothetical protein [Trichocoleus sp. FACHB-262]MBD2122263.1 hypothetical protein [Trichocoleus sp. FACHB-262]
MLHHLSVSVKNPQHVASVLAEVLQGRMMPFPPNPGSYIVFAADEFGTGIELYPLGSELIPDAWEGQAGFQINEQQSSQYTPVHAAFSVSLSLEEIERIGERESWRVLPANRDGLFDVVEFWVENRLMLEFFTPAMAQKYMNVFSPAGIEQAAQQFVTTAEARR